MDLIKNLSTIYSDNLVAYSATKPRDKIYNTTLEIDD